MLERLVLQANDVGLAVALSDLIDTVPIGFTSAGIVCRIRSDAHSPRVFHVANLMRLGRGGAPRIGFVRPGRNSKLAPLADFNDKKRANFLKRIEAITSFGSDIFAWFDRSKTTLTRAKDINLPTSGLFTEAILGRSNAAEKIDLTRFINWQDMPIPNAAPSILSVDTGSRAQATPALTVSNTDGVLNILPPTALPDPSGLANVLAAVQNGAIFRDMSQAAVLGTILSNLAGVAQRTATSAGQLSGDALAATLQSATALANKVADATQGLAGGAFKSMTELGGRLGEIEKIEQPAAQKAKDIKALVRGPVARQEAGEKEFSFQFLSRDINRRRLEGSYFISVSDHGRALILVNHVDIAGSEFIGNSATLSISEDDFPIIVEVVPRLNSVSTGVTLQGESHFALSKAKSTVTLEIEMETTSTKVLSTSQTEARTKFTKSIQDAIAGELGGSAEGGADAGAQNETDAIIETLKISLSALLKLAGFFKVSAGQTITTDEEEDDSVGASETREFTLTVPTGGLRISLAA